MVEDVIREVDILDYETVVEYTEDGQNRVAAFGKLSENIEETLLGRAITHGKPFEDWQKWVPADATAYSIGTGVYLHEIYVGVLAFVRDRVPESHETLDQWDELQEKVGVNLDEDILQSFSGEHVSITLADKQTVSAFKCSDPKKIRELMDRAIAGLKQRFPAAGNRPGGRRRRGPRRLSADSGRGTGDDAQQAGDRLQRRLDDHRLEPGRREEAAGRAPGDEDSIEGAESLKRFDLKTDGEVYSVKYSDVGAGIRAAADGIDQFAMMAPLLLGAAMQSAKAEDVKTFQKAIAILPSVAKVMRKFDFYEQTMSIMRKGPEDGTYLREAVTLIRQPAKK